MEYSTLLTHGIFLLIFTFISCSHNDEDSSYPKGTFFYESNPSTMRYLHEKEIEVHLDSQFFYTIRHPKECIKGLLQEENYFEKIPYSFKGDQLIVTGLNFQCQNTFEGGTPNSLFGTWDLVEETPLDESAENCHFLNTSSVQYTFEKNRYIATLSIPNYCYSDSEIRYFESYLKESSIKVTPEGCNGLKYTDDQGNALQVTMLSSSMDHNEWRVTYNNKSCVNYAYDIEITQRLCNETYQNYLAEDGEAEYYFEDWVDYPDPMGYNQCIENLEIPPSLAEFL